VIHPNIFLSGREKRISDQFFVLVFIDLHDTNPHSPNLLFLIAGPADLKQKDCA